MRDLWFGLIEAYGVVGVVLMGSVVVLWLTQMFYWAVRLYPLPRYRNRTDVNSEPISVVVVIQDPDEYYLEEIIPHLLEQEYPVFEVVVVDVAGDEFYTQQLNFITQRDGRLVVARVARNDRSRLADKVALNIGIKTAQYENIVLTTTACKPVSKLWLATFGKAFGCGAQVVLGYCNFERGKGAARLLMRLDSFTASVRWLAAAIHRRPYCGTVHNLGLARSVYFEKGGFNHLSLARGIDNLFVQHIATKTNSAVITSPAGMVLRRAWGGSEWWLGERLDEERAHRHFTGRARRSNSTELILRELFFIAVIVVAAVMPVEIALGALGLYLLRLLTVMLSLNGIRKRLGERRLVRWIPIYDFAAPIYELTLHVISLLRPAPRWK